MKNNVTTKIVGFVLIVFLLLGVLFGLQIMTFLFGNIGQANINSLNNPTASVDNLTGAYINSTGFTIPEVSGSTFLGGFVVVAAYNYSSGALIPSSNYTVDSTAGTIVNSTVTTYSNVSLTYTYTYKSEERVATESTNNNSINAIVTYTEQADTQLNTAAIAITLLILIALFLVFWVAFISPMMKQGKENGGNFA